MEARFENIKDNDETRFGKVPVSGFYDAVSGEFSGEFLSVFLGEFFCVCPGVFRFFGMIWDVNLFPDIEERCRCFYHYSLSTNRKVYVADREGDKECASQIQEFRKRRKYVSHIFLS